MNSFRECTGSFDDSSGHVSSSLCGLLRQWEKQNGEAPNPIKALMVLFLAFNPFARVTPSSQGMLAPATDSIRGGLRQISLASSASMRKAALSPYTKWLLANGAVMDGVELSWISDAMGVGLIATRDLPADIAVCQVPRQLLLSAASGLEDALLGPILELVVDELEGDVSEGLIALQLLHAATSVQRGEKSHWEAYLRMLPEDVNTPVLWPRKLRNSLLAGTSLLAETREARGAMCLEFRRLRRKLRQSSHEKWLELFGLTRGPCPLSGQDSSALQHWLLARSLVRSRVYSVPDDDVEQDYFSERLEGEAIMAPLMDMANHDDKLDTGFAWGDGVLAPTDCLMLCTEHEVRAGSPVHISYGTHSRCSSILSFGFSTKMQWPTFACSLVVEPTDPHVAQKIAVLQALDVLQQDGRAFFELPTDPPEIFDELMQVFRLLALPPTLASRLFDGVGNITDKELPDGFLEKFVGITDMSMERAAFAKLLRTCRRKLFDLRETKNAMPVDVAPELASVAAVVRETEVEALQVFLTVAREEARELSREAPTDFE